MRPRPARLSTLRWARSRKPVAVHLSWSFTDRARRSRLAPSMGSIGDLNDNGMIESIWARMQTELLNRTCLKTRIELVNGIVDYLEIFHNRQRRHSALDVRTSIEFELLHQSAQLVATGSQYVWGIVYVFPYGLGHQQLIGSSVCRVRRVIGCPVCDRCGSGSLRRS
jgi:hypothetical protein